MRKFSALLIVLIMLLSLCAGAAAEEMIRFDPAKGEGDSAWTCTPGYTEKENYLYTEGNWAYTSRDGLKYLITPTGEPLLDGKGFASFTATDYGYLEITAEDGSLGLLSPAGVLVLPVEYGKIFVISEKLIIGVRLRTAVGDEPYEYTDYMSGETFVASSADVFYDGALILTLQEGEFNGGRLGATELNGRYFFICSKENQGIWYDITGQKTGAVSDYATEFSYDWDEEDIWTHVPTGLRAFTPGCPLTEEDVGIPVAFDEETGKMTDLQGNVLFTVSQEICEASGWDIERVTKDWILLESPSRYIFFDRQGNCLADIAANEGEYLYLKDSDGPLFCFASDSNIFLLDVSVPSVVEYELPEGYQSGYYYSARYHIAVNEETGIVLLFTAEDSIYLGDVAISEDGKELLIVRAGDEYYLIDLKGNVLLKDCDELAEDCSFCTAVNDDWENQTWILTKH